eukprot:scaffold12586_cov132-Isochrysis_galbana.AAC.5
MVARRYRLYGPPGPRSYGISVGSPLREPLEICNASTHFFTVVSFISDNTVPMPSFSEMLAPPLLGGGRQGVQRIKIQ